MPGFVMFLSVVVGTLTALVAKPSLPKKETQDRVPVVEVHEIVLETVRLTVHSHGVVEPKFDTNFVSQVEGEVVYISPAFERGELVKQGEVIARIDDTHYKTAKIRAESALLTVKASLDQEKAESKVAENQWTKISKTAPTDLSLRKPQLARESARLRAAQADLKQASKDLKKTTIVAPFDALVGQRSVSLGAYVQIGTPIGNLKSTTVARVRLPVAGHQLKFIAKDGIGADVTLHKTEGDTQYTWPAKVIRSEGVVDETSRMIYLVAEVENPYLIDMLNADTRTQSTSREVSPKQLLFGSYITAEVHGEVLNEAVRLPEHLVWDNRVAVFENNRMTYKNVEVIAQSDGQVVVRSGLQNGDKLIVSALDTPIEGMPLQLQEPNGSQNHVNIADSDQ
jgi:RND family efflux transporter MFP subunit